MSLIMWKPRPSRAGMAIARGAGMRVFRDARRQVRWLLRNPHFRTVNWGNVVGVELNATMTINKYDSVKLAASKYETCQLLRRLNIPAVQVSKVGREAYDWYYTDRRTVLYRKDGLSAGKGIKIMTPPKEGTIFDVPWYGFGDCQGPAENYFYSRYYPKTHEFRVHVAGGKVIDIVEKKHRNGTERNSLVRNHANGWVFAHNNLALNEEDLEKVKTLAIQGVTALGLDFGAVDILVRRNPETRRMRGARICEINTAPGLENSATLEAYINYFKEIQRG